MWSWSCTSGGGAPRKGTASDHDHQERERRAHSLLPRALGRARPCDALVQRPPKPGGTGSLSSEGAWCVLLCGADIVQPQGPALCNLTTSRGRSLEGRRVPRAQCGASPCSEQESNTQLGPLRGTLLCPGDCDHTRPPHVQLGSPSKGPALVQSVVTDKAPAAVATDPSGRQLPDGQCAMCSEGLRERPKDRPRETSARTGQAEALLGGTSWRHPRAGPGRAVPSPPLHRARGPAALTPVGQRQPET